jgi:hypothetical protein
VSKDALMGFRGARYFGSESKFYHRKPLGVLRFNSCIQFNDAAFEVKSFCICSNSNVNLNLCVVIYDTGRAKIILRAAAGKNLRDQVKQRSTCLTAIQSLTG